MTYKVEIQPANRKFIVEENTSILEAAIRAGVTLNYGCSSGNCGLCKARVIHGEVKNLRSHDYVIPQSEKIQGYKLMCSTGCQSDLLIQADVVDKATDIPVQDLRVKVRKINRISEELAIVTTQVPRAQRLRFIAGQYMRVYDDNENSHDYAIASCPCDDKRIEFHVRKLDEDPFSNIVFENLSVGNWLNIQGPYGDFVIDEESEHPIIMLAFDTGFAATKSLLEHITAQDSERSINLIWLACGAEGLYLDNLCRSWADALDQMNYIPISLNQRIDEILDNDYEGLGSMEVELVKAFKQLGEIGDAEVFIVAPEPVAKMVQQLMTQEGITIHKAHHEIIRGNPNLSCIHPHL